VICLLFPLLSKDITSTITDEQAVQGYLESQSPRYFNILYKRYSPKIFGKCVSLLKDEARAEDATQEIFMKIILNLSKFSGKSKFSTWIYSITYNYCIDVIRRKKKDLSILVDDIANTHDKADDDINEKFLLEMNVRRLKVVLDKIPVTDRSILLMKYQDQMSIKEIGDVMAKSESAIKMKIKRAKQKCQKAHKAIFKDD